MAHSSLSLSRVASVLLLTAFKSHNLSSNIHVHNSIFTNAFTAINNIPPKRFNTIRSYDCNQQNQQHCFKQQVTALHVASITTSDYFSNLEDGLPEHKKRQHVIEIQGTPRLHKKRTRRRAKKVATSMTKLSSKSSTTLAPDPQPSKPTNYQYNPIDAPTTQKQNGSKNKGLLSREDEATLTYAIRSLRKAIKIRDDLALSNELSDHTKKHKQNSDTVTEEEWANACGLSVNDLRRVMLAGQDARTQLVSKNTGLVVQIAKRYHSRSLDNSILTLQDMVQEGNLGLMEAAERFDPRRGFKFGTYAAWWVRQRILRSIADHSRVIRLPAHGKCSIDQTLMLNIFDMAL